MKLLTCKALNFGSYKEFEIDFEGNGLALIYGRTGAGKSTIPDVPCWTLFGQTAKGGAVDDIRSWQNDGEPTYGTLEVETNDGSRITVVRVRGSAKQNDLYWIEADSPDVLVRGKDLADTQKKLCSRLGLSADTYIAASYFHEFSTAGQFFTAKAKDRREIFEGIANLDLPAKLADAASTNRKQSKQKLVDNNQKLVYTQGRYSQLLSTQEQNAVKAQQWEDKQKAEIATLVSKVAEFEVEKQDKIATAKKRVELFETKRQQTLAGLVENIERTEGVEKLIEQQGAEVNRLKARETELKLIRCKSCGGPTGAKEIDTVRAELDKVKQLLSSNTYVAKERETQLEALAHHDSEENPYTSHVTQAETWTNPYADALKRAKEANNPWLMAQDVSRDIVDAQASIETLKKEVAVDTKRYEALDRLYNLTGDLRGELLKRTVKQIEDNTNRYLDSYFDAEIRVEFAIDGDDLNVTLQKSGYECGYKQLSKGQRSLLRLCFVVSVMQAAANKCGAHFGTLFFDEALDGLDSDLKVKAFSLFSELETNHESVLLIDHAPEFQQMFTKRYSVTMSEDVSELSLEES